MNRPALCSILLVAVLSYGFLGLAQQQQAVTNVIVPRLIRFGGVLKDADGTPLQGKAGITFGLYKDQDGGAALWLETQNVSLDSSGHYSVLLGATKEEGVPMDLFTSGAAQWLGIQVQGQSEHPRVLLVSVPYALKAADAETLGGLPPSAFAPAPKTSSTTKPVSTAPTTVTATGAATTLAPTGSGTTNFVPLWTNSSTLGNSTVSQVGGNVGIGFGSPLPGSFASKLDVNGGAFIRGALNLPALAPATTLAGTDSNPLNLTASSFKSGIVGGPVNQTFQWRAEPLFNNSPAPSGTLNLLFGSGTNIPTETGVLISSGGQIQAPSIFDRGNLVVHGSFLGVSGSFGSLGIGIIPPQARLDVVGGGNVDTLIGDPGCGANFAGVGFININSPLSGCGNYALLGDNLGHTYINSHGTGAIHLRHNNTSNLSPDQMTITSAGNVGIGTDTPQATLDVNGNINIAGGINSNGGGFKHLRVPVSVDAGAGFFKIFWRSAFPDANYTVVGSVEDLEINIGIQLQFVNLSLKTASSVDVFIQNPNNSAKNAVIDLIAIHD